MHPVYKLGFPFSKKRTRFLTDEEGPFIDIEDFT